jgi:hypothetical protein
MQEDRMQTLCLVRRRSLRPAVFGLAAATVLVAGCSGRGTAPAAASGAPPRGSTAPSAAAALPGSRSLVVRSSGWGRGTVSVTPDPGLVCEDFDESQDFMQVCTGVVGPSDASVVVSVAPVGGSTFTGWAGGPCAGTAAAACPIPMDRDQVIDVVFQLGSSGTPTPAPSPAPGSVVVGIDLLGAGTGTITSSPDVGLACVRSGSSNVSATCSAQVPAASLPLSLTLQATPGAGSAFSGWGASCSGSTGATCSLTIAAAARVTAGFVPSAPGTPPAPLPPPPSLAIVPSTLALEACQGHAFQVEVPPGTDPRVTWSVQEAAGGAVTNGVYSAPNVAGTYHVVARSQSAQALQAVATVTVAAEKLLSVAVAPGSAQALPGGGLKFVATVTTTCGTFQAN